MELAIFLQGSIFMAVLLASMGPQNIFVLHTGLGRAYTLEVVIICIFGDLVLSVLGLLGVGHVFESWPQFVPSLKFLAVAMLSYYLLEAARRLSNPQPLEFSSFGHSSFLLGAFAVTFLNPYVYLDTVFLLGASAAPYGSIGKWIFVCGALLASCVWYTSLGFGARLVSSYATSAKFSWWVDLVTVLVMGAGIALFCC